MGGAWLSRDFVVERGVRVLLAQDVRYIRRAAGHSLRNTRLTYELAGPTAYCLM